MGPGAYLRAAREAAGWSLEQAAQQLKLAPRQVKALEEEDFAQLPGRTFARGFVRNYARLLHLDADELLAQLPDPTRAPGLGAPALHSTSTMMGELPTSESTKPSFARWLIPLALIGCIVAAASYEWYRGGLSIPGERVARTGQTGERTAVDIASQPSAVAVPQPRQQLAPPPGAAPTAQSGAGIASQIAGTSLPNPFVTGAGPTDGSTAAPAAEPTRPSGASETVAAVTPPAPTSGQQSAAPSVAQASVATAAQSGAATPPAATPAVSAVNAPLVLKYRGPSWTEIKDRNGQVLIARLVAANSMQPIDGTPPFHVVLGNARVVNLAYRGKSIDLSRYTRQNVARLTLR